MLIIIALLLKKYRNICKRTCARAFLSQGRKKADLPEFSRTLNKSAGFVLVILRQLKDLFGRDWGRQRVSMTPRARAPATLWGRSRVEQTATVRGLF